MIQKGYPSTYLAMGFANVRAGIVPGTRPNISESHSEISTRVPFCITASVVSQGDEHPLESVACTRALIRAPHDGYLVPARTLANPIARRVLEYPFVLTTQFEPAPAPALALEYPHTRTLANPIARRVLEYPFVLTTQFEPAPAPALALEYPHTRTLANPIARRVLEYPFVLRGGRALGSLEILNSGQSTRRRRRTMPRVVQCASARPASAILL